MNGLVLGTMSFCVVFWVDIVALRKLNWLKPILWLASTSLFVYALVRTLDDPAVLSLPPIVHAIGWVLSALFALLLIYSLFFEIPFLSAYVKSGGPSGLMSRGTYALCRHPGVLWFGGFLVGAILAHGTRWLLISAPVWFALDALWAFLQERLFFVRLFGSAYIRYQRTVPMFIPSRESVRACFRSLTKPEIE